MTITAPQNTEYYGDVAPETCLRIYDQMMVDWLSSLRFRDQTPKVVTVWASRQFSQQHEIHNDKPVKQAFPFPVISLISTGIVPALDRRSVQMIQRLGITEIAITGETLATGDGTSFGFVGNTNYAGVSPGSVTITATRTVTPGPVPPATYATMTVTDDGDGNLIGDVAASPPSVINYTTGRYQVNFAYPVTNNTSIVGAYTSSDSRIYTSNERTANYVLPFPLPFDITYQMDIWTKTQQDMQLLRTALLSRFSFVDETFLECTIPGYGEKLIPVRLGNLSDTTDVEPDEKNRELRNTITMTVKGWIFRCPLTVKNIRRLNVALLDAGSDPVNLQDGSAFMDWYCDIDHYSFDGNYYLDSVQESSRFAPPARALAWMGFDEHGVLAKTGP